MFRLAPLLPPRRPSCRRRALCTLVATALLPVGRASSQPTAPARSPTPSQPEGPFYPKTFPADRDSDLTQVLGRAAKAQGTPLYLSGRVFTRDGKAVASATVELWQCDVHGRYHHAGDDGVPRDDNFQGYGVASTDADARYAFKTIRPVPYGGRPPHMHLRVRSSGSVLTTQIYIAGDALAGDSVLSGASSGTIRQLTMALAPLTGREPGAISGTFDLVLP